MVHSGSRNVGYKVASHYFQKAKEMCNKWYSSVPEGLSFFPLKSQEFKNYKREMDYCIEFALANRTLMVQRIKESFKSVLKRVEFSQFINKPHNFAAWENHFNQNVIIHRKGATRARNGELGMIPGSQGTSSYIVEGKGNKHSFKSCSHGAGRTMSRTKARKTLSLKEETQKLEEKGILHAIRTEKDLDEAPGSYKDIEKVMKNQQDLIDIKIKLKPLATIKAH